MRTFHSYDDLWRVPVCESPVLEAYRGTDIVSWWGQIENSLIDNIDKYEGSRNQVYVDKLRAFLKIWRDNRLDGSINRETLETLHAAAEIEQADKWDLAKYFRSIRNNLAILIASEEELPRIGADGAGGPDSGGMGLPAGGPPKPGKLDGPTSEFGPETEAPGEPGGGPETGAPGGPTTPNPVDTAINTNNKLRK